MRQPHYLRFARSLALVGALGVAACGDDDKTGDTADTADSVSETVQPDTTTPDTMADTAPETVEDTIADTTPETVEDTIADTAVDCDACDCGSADASESCISACCIAVGPLYPPDLPA